MDEIDREAMPSGEGEPPRRRRPARQRPGLVSHRRTPGRRAAPRPSRVTPAQGKSGRQSSVFGSATPRPSQSSAAGRTPSTGRRPAGRSPRRRRGGSPRPGPRSAAARRGSPRRCNAGCRTRSSFPGRTPSFRPSPARLRRRRSRGACRRPRFRRSRWASASERPASARNVLATVCDRSRIGGVNGRSGEIS